MGDQHAELVPATKSAKPSHKKIKVLFVQSQVAFGADSAVHSDLMRRLDRDRFEVHLACTRGDGSRVPDSLARLQVIPDVRLRLTRFAPGFHERSLATILREARAGATFPFDFVALARYIRRNGIGIIHSSERPRDSVYNVALARLTRTKSVVHVHVKWAAGYSAAAKWGVRQADAVIGISRFVSESVVAMGKPRDRVHTICNGIDVTKWDPAIDGSGIRREFSIPQDAPLLVSVSRLFAGKGQRELFRAFARVREQVPDVRLLVVGADALYVHGGSFTHELRALARELDVAERIVFAGERADIPQVMAACDVFTMPSGDEPFGLVFLEAMAMRKPVVALDNGGTPEVVEHGRSGLLSPQGDVRALADNIVTLLKDGELRARMGAHGRARVLERFTAQRMAQDVGDAYAKILDSGRPPMSSCGAHRN